MHNLTFVHQERSCTMKTILKKQKSFDTVKVFQEIKKKIAMETETMTFAEFKAYLKKNNMTPGL
jgi:hypothetical protein